MLEMINGNVKRTDNGFNINSNENKIIYRVKECKLFISLIFIYKNQFDFTF